MKNTIHAAVQENNPKKVTKLLRGSWWKRKLDPNEANTAGERPLHVAVRFGHAGLISILASHGAELDARDQKGMTALHYAVQRLDRNATDCLLNVGADHRIKTPVGDGMLHLLLSASLQNRESVDALFGLLLQRGTDLAARNEKGVTPLHLAIKNGFVGVADILLNAGVDVDVVADPDGTPLHVAIMCSRSQLLDKVLALTKNVDLPTKDGVTALHFAVASGNPLLVKRLIERGAAVNAKDRKGWSALTHAARTGQKELVLCLIQAGVDVNAEDDFGLTALMRAVEKHHLEVAEALLCHGADVNCHDFMAKVTPLIGAAVEGDERMVDLLLRHGSNIHSRDLLGRTALDHAKAQRRTDIITLLERK